MKWQRLEEAARLGRLYPAIILHGSDLEERRTRALELARILLCSADPEDRPCLECSHCRRLQGEPNHPDFHILERDLKASTSIGATREFFRGVLLAPYEAAAQVFVVAEGESLRPEAADTLLKILEEPPGTTPRHFFLLSASRTSLLPTIRSRCLSFYLGPSRSLEEDRVEDLAQELRECLGQFQETGSPAYLLASATVLEKGGAWDDPRNRRPWEEGAAALLACARDPHLDRHTMLRLLALAQDLQVAHRWRERGLRPGRILEGLFFRHLSMPSCDKSLPGQGLGG